MARNRNHNQPPQRSREEPQAEVREDDATEADEANVAAPEPTERSTAYVVAKGRSVSTQRGIVDAGSAIRAEDVGGEEFIAALIAHGVVEAA